MVIAIGLVFLTRNYGPTHEGLKNSELPPLIPTRAFYADPKAEFGFHVSNDGKYTASEKASLLGRNIVVREIGTDKIVAKYPPDIRHIRWHPSKPLLRFIYDGHDWESDPFNPSQENWIKTSPIALSGGWYKEHVVTDDTMPVLTWGKRRNSEEAHMWLVSQDGLRAEKVADGNSDTQYWVFDKQFDPVLRADSLDTRTYRVFLNSNGAWEKLIGVDVNDIFQPLSFVDDNGKLLVRSSRGRDKAVLAEFDVSTGIETILVENPKADIAWVQNLSFDFDPDTIRLGADTAERIALTDRGETLLEILADFPQPITFGHFSPTSSGRFVTLAISPQNKSYIFLLLDLEGNSYSVLKEYHFRRFKDHLVQDRTVTFRARDGLDIPAVLTLPNGVDGPIPFIVEIHGGPSGHFGVGYDHDRQFLANRGYGILSVNFRGSNGYGKAFQAKGFKEFGRAMQDDITDAANWLIEEGLADPDALIAMGTSYGGYSAALAMTRDPGLFDAAIVEFPMLDVEFQTRHRPGFWENDIALWQRYFGELDNPDDLEDMRKFSPTNLTNQIHGPILLLGGLRDEITDVRQAKIFEQKAKAVGKEIESHYFPEAGHGINYWKDHLKRARLIEDFLAKHAGGRSGGFELVEKVPSFIK